VGQDDPLGPPGQHLLHRLAKRVAVAPEAELHVDGRLAVGVGCAAQPQHEAQEGAADPVQLEVLDQLGDDQGARNAVTAP